MKSSNYNRQQKKQIEDFRQTTQCSENQAIKQLTQNKWNMQQALNSFYDHGGKKQQQKQIPQIQDLFKKLNTNNVIQQQGFVKLLQDYLKIDLQNPVIGHILTNVMRVPKASINNIPKQCLYNLFDYCNAHTLKQVIKNIPQLEKQLKQPKIYQQMYLQLYDIYLVKNIGTLDFDIAQAVWRCYLKDIMVFYNEFFEFIEQLGEKKPPKVHKDLWNMTYQFAKTIKKIQDHKPEDLWPGFLDDFVEYLKDKKK